MAVKILLQYAFMFFIGSIGGWIIELLFRRFISTKHWINPGFLVGPYLPLYGFGLCGLFTLANINLSFFGLNKTLTLVILFIIMTIVMTIIEFITGIIFLKGLNIRLWDYSKRWCNINGIICPLFTLIWGLIGIAYYFLLNPYIKDCLNWLTDNIAFSFIIGMFFGVLLIDLIYSFDLANKVKKFANDKKIIVQYENFKITTKSYLKGLKIKTKFFFQFISKISMKEHLENYFNRIKEKKNK